MSEKSTERRNELTESLEHRARGGPVKLQEAFADDPKRFDRFSARLDDLLLDYSKCALDDAIVDQLIELAVQSGVGERRDAMFDGQPINGTEQRAVLHVALRNRSGKPVHLRVPDGEDEDVMPGIRETLDAMATFARGVRDGSITGARGKRITDVVNIGIGGSDFGPAMATLALAPYHNGPRIHYVSNVDGAHLHDTLRRLYAPTTMFVIASKTFTTVETMTNARTAREWVRKGLETVSFNGAESDERWTHSRPSDEEVGAQFAAVSTALDKVAEFGIREDRVFGFGEWVGGRYSLWSAIGLPLMIAIGPERFTEFLEGGHAMDRNFRETWGRDNLPMMLGLVGWWHRVACGYPARAVIPYDQRLSRLPAYLQQLDMESNGKGVHLDGSPAPVTGPIVFGEPGTNGQHAFFQLLHQGTDVVPVEFIVGAKGHEEHLAEHQELLLANCLAQSEALMRGRSEEEAFDLMRGKGMDEEEARRLAPHRAFPGERPSVTIMHERLTPHALGRLIALYEHRVFVEGALFGINSFDQWGVELGKELATNLLPVVRGEDAKGHDASTRGLIEHVRGLSAS